MATTAASSQSVNIAGLSFRNPVVLASGTAGYGREVDDVIDLSQIGGISTKAVSVEPRHGAKPLRVAEFAGGMINAVGLANPGVEVVKRDALPWLRTQHPDTRVLVNVIGNKVEDFATVVATLAEENAVDAFELNVSCPNVKAGGMEFGADPAALAQLVSRAREATSKPIFVKLSPTLGLAVVDAARTAIDAGASGLTLVNTMPGLVIDVEEREPRIGFGTGGVSGPALLPIGLLAVRRVRQALNNVPIIGLGGISRVEDAVAYLLAGANLVGVGTAALRDPRAPERIARDLARWCDRHEVNTPSELVGALQWPA
jgi:dihydroorotate dehydrogenase (NAD+) catalytic subunit